MKRVAIAGAGLLGRLLAWRLSRQGHTVQLFEANPKAKPTSAAYTAAAMVAPFSERPVAHDEVFQRGLRSLQLWPEFLAELEQDVGYALTLGRGGSVLVAHPSDQAELQQFQQQLQHTSCWQQEQAHWLNSTELNRLEPNLNPQFKQAIALPQELFLDARQCLSALLQAAEQYGTEVYFDCPVTISGQHWQCHSDSAMQGKIQADIYLDCRGIGLKADIDSARSIRGVRGEVCWIESEVCIQHAVRLMHPRYRLYLVPRGEADSGSGRYRYILGATEIESEDKSPVSVRSAMEILSALYCLNPAFAEARILEWDVNLRPAYDDHRAYIDEMTANHYRLNGLFRHGYLQAPALLKEWQSQSGISLGITQ